MERIKVELEVEKVFLFLQKMVHFTKEHGRMIICGVTVDWSLKISTTKVKSETELLTVLEHSRTVKKYIQDSGDVIKDMETVNKYTKISVIDIKVNSQTINIMVEGYYKIKNIHILVTSYKDCSMEMEWLDIKLDKYLLGDLGLVKE